MATAVEREPAPAPRDFPMWRFEDIVGDEAYGARVKTIWLTSGDRIAEITSTTSGPGWISVKAGHGESSNEYLVRTEAIAYVTMGR